ncbi:OLC1v1008152C3 [Oldenlandia corymbosa var. corymbosa]|uniref:OLC1v1008152C3 n=1 Tax=Oldenlandia corymbosa var. corymbosa TaxID=529605 RepID=A0AAV1DKW6_OLDCO|nr:OLC1v1008152C3 [Oldenlandia corymbosa var. corymbosa]
MEKTPVAYSMEWSIELEKGLRSKSHSKRIETISKFGKRIEWWNRQPEVSGRAEYKMFGFIPGEDKLFLNAILLRLADAFRTGDKGVKRCIVKIFLTELKSRRKRDKGEEGVFSKSKLNNYLEILTRVKVVLEGDSDTEDRALALYLLGCWADFAKDCASIRYSLLASLSFPNGDDNLEMKASLFAAWRFSELADDFACIFLGILTTKLGSMETSLAFKLAGCRALAKMGRCALSVASGAYKAGLRLLLDSAQSDQTFSIEMLISLTKIASRWTMLITSHMELLSAFLVEEDEAVCLQVVTLKCLQFVLANGIWCPGSVAARGVIMNLIDIVSKSEFSSALLGKALKVLHQMLCYYIPSCHFSEMLEVLSMLFVFINNMFQSSTMSERLFSIWMLLDILGKCLGKDGPESGEIVSILANQITTFVMDRMFVLMKLDISKYQSSEETGKEVKSLLRIVLNLIEIHSDVCGLVLDKITIFMKHLVDVLGDINMEKEDVTAGDVSECEALNPLRCVLYLAKMTNICVEYLEEQTDSYEFVNPLKLLVDHVLPSASLQLYTPSIYMLLLHFRNSYICIWLDRNHLTDDSGKYNLSCGDFFEQYDSFIFESAKKMFERRDFWSFYQAGKHAACLGHWSIATFIFEQLTKLVLSDPNYIWLKSLALISHSEGHLESFGRIALKKTIFQEGEGIASVFNRSHYAEALNEACNGLHAARRTLDASVPGLSTKFLDWFLFLRAKVLEIMKDIICLLEGVSFTRDTDRIMLKESLISLETLRPLVSSLSRISYRLKKVANECDLLLVSFFGMDAKSAMIISALAASCSLLAFSTGLVFSIPLLYASAENPNSCLETSEKHFYVMLIHDLLERLNLTEFETRESLLMLLRAYKESTTGCILPHCQNKGTGVCCRARCFVKISRYAVREIVTLKTEAAQISSGKSFSAVAVDGFQLLLRVIFKWMQIPFKCPSHFFQIRPDVKSELFISDGDGKIIEGMSVPLGSPLSLNVCLQVKNMPSSLPTQLSKLYCILSCTTEMESLQGNSKEQSGLNSEKWENDEMLDLYGKLVKYVTGSSKYKASNSLTVEEYLHFQPNQIGQGFSTCMLDISAFPVGIYRIQWHSCFVDNEGCYWSLLPLNAGPSFTIAEPPCSRFGGVEQLSNLVIESGSQAEGAQCKGSELHSPFHRKLAILEQSQLAYVVPRLLARVLGDWRMFGCGFQFLYAQALILKVENTVEVDYNAPRHLNTELKRMDWKSLLFDDGTKTGRDG